MAFNWPILRKVFMISISLLLSSILLLDFIPRHMVEHGYTFENIKETISTLDSEPKEEVFVPKFKRYREDKTERERQQSIYNLGRMDLIRKANSDPLPNRMFNGSALSLCGNDNGTLCIPKFKRLETRIRVADKYNLMTCIIQKSMSTVMTAIMCYLYNEDAFTAAGREFAKECTQIRFCQRKNEFAQVMGVRKVHHIGPKEMKNWKFTMITRDPIDRFLSGYVDKCIRYPRSSGYCNRCGRNMTCFIMSEYARMQSQLEQGRMFRTFEDRHFFPQNWRCDLNREYDNYHFLRYSSDPSGTLLEDLIPVLRQQKVPEQSIDFIKSQLNKGRTVHSTVQSEARSFYENRLRSSPFLLEYIIRIFYYDFVLFKYPFPEGF